MESKKQEKYNLLHDNPVAKHGSWMSKHVSSPINYGSPMKKDGDPVPSVFKPGKNYAGLTISGDIAEVGNKKKYATIFKKALELNKEKPEVVKAIKRDIDIYKSKLKG